MLMPTLSVTAIGVAVGLLVVAFRGRPGRVVLWTVLGAWVGFLLGGVLGGVIDVAARSGEGVPILGHLAAGAGAVVAAHRFGAGPGRDRPDAPATPERRPLR